MTTFARGLRRSGTFDLAVGVPTGSSSAPAVVTPPVEPASRAALVAGRHWYSSYRTMLVSSDVASVMLTLAACFVVHRLIVSSSGAVAPSLLVVVGIAVAWLGALVACDAYEVRRDWTGAEEWQRLTRALALAFGLVVTGCYFFEQSASRTFIAPTFAAVLLVLSVGRVNIRRVVRARRADLAWHHRVLAVGTRDSIEHFVTMSGLDSGVTVVGACTDEFVGGDEICGGVPAVGRVEQASAQAERLGADLVAVTGGNLAPAAVRSLCWELEGSGRGLVFSHPVSDVAAPRLHVSPLNGMPMVWVDEPQFTGPARRLKRAFDVAVALTALVVLAPVLAVVAILVALTSRGPVFFRQSRLGRAGTQFDVLKFRTMVDGAEAMRDDLVATHRLDGALFKIREDPRITPLGSWLRRLSVDELPQLWNVVRGDMSLVGPRPLATQDSAYDGPARRRLLVRPGITGLWQVSGRSDLSWEDAVKLDLYYVANWSLSYDMLLIGKTAVAVLRRRGAY